MATPRLLLASASPRRRALLQGVGLDAIVQDPRVPESDVSGTVAEQVTVLARRKAEAVAAAVWSGWVIGADTLGVLDGKPLGKPADVDDARRILRALAGRSHEVTTGVCVLRCEDGAVVDRAQGSETTRVHFLGIPDATIDAYIATGEPMDKAGAYAIQGQASAFIDRIDGSWTNVVGLPVHTVLRLLHRLDFPLAPHLRLEA